jgi:DNA polymerase III subunit delta'
VLDDIVGQEEAVKYLRRFVAGLIDKPLLLVGDEGTGRRSAILKVVLEMVVAKRGATSPEAVQVRNGTHPDVVTISAPEGKEIGVEPIREMLDRSVMHPISAPHRFFIIDGVDQMTPAAANAILKKIEEPPALSRFFLLAESYDRVIPTIRSRCGRVNFRRLPESFIFQRLSEFEPDSNKALVYARLGEGSVGRAIKYWGANRLTLRDRALTMLESSAMGDVSSTFSVIDELSKDLNLTLKFLIFLVHDVLVGGVDQSRVVNQDLEEELSSMRSRVKASTWGKLWESLRTVNDRNESAYVNLGFQLKSAFALTFCGE